MPYLLVDLVPGGSGIAVTEANKAEYALALARWRMHGAIKVTSWQIQATPHAFIGALPFVGEGGAIS
eukprot:scaffold165300_cov19-Prasinocladus_malaysianus.AAC.1